MLWHKRLESLFFTETVFVTKYANHFSTRGNQYYQVFVSDKVYIVILPMKSQDEFKISLYWFYKEIGVLVDLIVDGFIAQKKLSVIAIP